MDFFTVEAFLLTTLDTTQYNGVVGTTGNDAELNLVFAKTCGTKNNVVHVVVCSLRTVFKAHRIGFGFRLRLLIDLDKTSTNLNYHIGKVAVYTFLKAHIGLSVGCERSNTRVCIGHAVIGFTAQTLIHGFFEVPEMIHLFIQTAVTICTSVFIIGNIGAVLTFLVQETNFIAGREGGAGLDFSFEGCLFIERQQEFTSVIDCTIILFDSCLYTFHLYSFVFRQLFDIVNLAHV